MAANTFQLMDALASPTAFGPNPHKWASSQDYPGALNSEYNQYAYDINGVLHSIATELAQLGVKVNEDVGLQVDPLPLNEPAEFLNWESADEAGTENDTQQNFNNVFRYMVNGGHTGGLLHWSGLGSFSLSLDDLYNLANNMVWCYHNLYSFAAWTDFMSGAVPKPDADLLYIPLYHSELAAKFSHFSQVLSLAAAYDSANSTHNAQSIIYTSINSTSIALISNNSPFAANDYAVSSGDYVVNPNPSIMKLGEVKAPSINSIAMWLYTANGTDSVTDLRPPGLEIDKIDDVHPAESMTPKEVYYHFLFRIQNYNNMIQGFLVDSPGSHPQGVTPANTFIYEAQDWLQKRTEALHIIDIMSRTTLPGGSSIAVQNAIANTS